MEKKVIVIDTGSQANHLMLSDVSKLNYVRQISDSYLFQNGFAKFLYLLHFGFRLNKYFDFPFKNLWDKRCILPQFIEDESQEVFFILINDTIRKLSPRMLEKLHNKKNVHIYVVLLDSYDKLQPYFRRCVNRCDCDEIYTFQKSDSIKYGFKYSNKLYSKIELKDNKLLYDFYFVGEDKGRIETLAKIYEVVTSQGYKCKFDIIVSKRDMRKYKNEFPFMNFENKRISYLSILENISKAKGILELCQYGQDGLTMRFYEAIFYNKVLITNSKDAVENELFNSKYMLFFEKPKDIIINKLDFDVEYHYQNQVSPIWLVQELIEG